MKRGLVKLLVAAVVVYLLVAPTLLFSSWDDTKGVENEVQSLQQINAGC